MVAAATAAPVTPTATAAAIAAPSVVTGTSAGAAAIILRTIAVADPAPSEVAVVMARVPERSAG